MKKIGKLIIALILIYIILVTSVADINHGHGINAFLFWGYTI